MADLILSEKYKAFLRCTAPVEFLEGTTAAGKTTVGLFKFMLRVAESPRRLHVLSGLDQGTIEKNIITKELGILEDFGDLVEYWPGGRGDDRQSRHQDQRARDQAGDDRAPRLERVGVVDAVGIGSIFRGDAGIDAYLFGQPFAQQVVQGFVHSLHRSVLLI